MRSIAKVFLTTVHAKWLLPTVVITLFFGCGETVAPSHRDAEQPELTFAEQAAAVREGLNDTIRVDHETVRDDELAALDAIRERLRRLNLSHTEITDAGMERIADCPHLEQLRLASPNVTDAGLAHVAKLSELRFLHLLQMPITDAGLDKLHGLPRLESLYLDGTKVTDEGLAGLVAALPNVHLHVDDHHHPLDAHGDEHKH
jgi:Leucine-rich repeat (LRR) protein